VNKTKTKARARLSDLVEERPDLTLASQLQVERENLPEHRGSVLGYTLFSMGFDPMQDGPEILGVSTTGISRILTGQRPTPIALMRRLEPLVDALQRNPAYLPSGTPVPFLCNARDWLVDSPLVRMSAIGHADPRMLVHPSKMERVMAMTGFDPAFDALADADDRDDWPQDSAGMWGACCNVVGWSRSDVAEALAITITQARRMIDSTAAAEPKHWRKLFSAYDALVADETSPVGVGIRWARAVAARTRSDVGRLKDRWMRREDIETAYAIGDGVPVLFADDDQGEE